MADIAYWDGEYTKEIEELKNLMLFIGNQSADGQEEKLDEAKQKLVRIATLKKNFNIEMRQLYEPNLRLRYNAKMTGYDKDVEKLKAQLEEAKTRLGRSELGVGEEHKGNDDYLDGALNVQGNTNSVLQNTINTAKEAQASGENTLEKLEEQRQQINEIGKSILDMRENLDYSMTLIGNFTKRMATDKCIQAFALVNMLLLLGVIIFVLLKKQGAI